VKTRTVVVAAIGVGALLWVGHSLWPDTARSVKPVFDGDSKGLKATTVVATLDTPMEKGRNTIWCASFLAAWKSLEVDLAGEPLTMQGSPPVAASLSSASDPRPDISPECLYAVAGSVKNGIVEQICRDLVKKFPGKTAPAFPGLLPDDLVAYAYLEVSLNFSIPYLQNNKPMIFTDSSGNKTELRSFGICPGDTAPDKLCEQPEILYVTADANNRWKWTECVIDLDRTSRTDQIVVAAVEQRPSLAETMKYVEERIAEARKDESLRGAGMVKVLVVPDIAWRISHHFAQLEGQEFSNEKLKGMRIAAARQDTEFRLNRKGAHLKSESYLLMKACVSISKNFIFDRPFLLYMKKRGADRPYFVMWVDNAELLAKWKPE
jgi:hypothetical protein